MKNINKFRQFSNSKTFYIIVSCLAAIFLWMYVVNYENKDIDNSISGITVEYLGEDDILADRGFVVSEGYDRTVTLKVLGKRSVVGSLTKDDVRVTVDLKDIRRIGEYDRVYDVSFPGVDSKIAKDIYIISKEPEYISLKIDEVITKPVEVRGDFDGSVAEGYMSEPVEYDPETIEVTGPAEQIAQIDHAWVVVQRENLTKTVSGITGFVLRDAMGAEISSEGISTDVQAVKYTVPVVTVKDVALTVELVAGGGATDRNAEVIIDPPVITLSGDTEELNSINSISLGTVDLSEFAKTFTKSYVVPIPNGINNLSGETEANVSVEIKGLTTKRIIATDIDVVGVSDGYRAQPITQYKEVLIRGPEEAVNAVSADDVHISADLSEIGQAVGRYSVTGLVYIEGHEGIGVVGKDYSIVVSVEEG